MLFKYADQKKTVGIYKCSAKKKAKRKEHNKNYSSDDVITCNNSFGKIREDILIDIVEKALSTFSFSIQLRYFVADTVSYRIGCFPRST